MNDGEMAIVDRSGAGEAIGPTKRGASGEAAVGVAELDHRRHVARVSRVLDYVFYSIYGLVSVKIIVGMLGARDPLGLTSFIDAVTAPMLALFVGRMRDVGAGQRFVILTYVVALGSYLMLHLALHGLLRLFAFGKKA